MTRHATWRLLGVALAVLLPGCAKKSPGPAAGPSGDYLRSYAGQQRVLRFQGDRDRLVVRKKDPAQLRGTCDVAVEVKSAVLDKGAPRLLLEPIGSPATDKGRPRCGTVPATITLSLTGYERDASGVVVGRLDQILPTPEGYLRAYGITVDAAAPGEPAVAASNPQHVNSTDDERRLERRVTTWPKRLFWVDPTLRDPRVRHEGEVEFEAVVGADGRIYRPQIKGGLEAHHIAAIKRALRSWRFEPARAGREPIPAYHTGRMVFTIR